MDNVQRWQPEECDARPEMTRDELRTYVTQIADIADRIVLDDYIFRQSMAAIRSSGHISCDNHVYQWLMDCYFSAATIRVRSMLDCDPRTYSLYNLLAHIEQSPEVLTRSVFLSRYQDEYAQQIGNEEFDKIAGKDAQCFHVDRIRADLARITAAAKIQSKNANQTAEGGAGEADRDNSRVCRIKQITDKSVAHNERSGYGTRSLVWDDLHSCIGDMRQMVEVYLSLLMGARSGSLLFMHESEIDDDVRAMWHFNARIEAKDPHSSQFSADS